MGINYAKAECQRIQDANEGNLKLIRRFLVEPTAKALQSSVDGAAQLVIASSSIEAIQESCVHTATGLKQVLEGAEADTYAGRALKAAHDAANEAQTLPELAARAAEKVQEAIGAISLLQATILAAQTHGLEVYAELQYVSWE